MPKKIDLDRELETIRQLPKDARRNYSVRIPSGLAWDLIIACKELEGDPSTVVRMILEDNIHYYLEGYPEKVIDLDGFEVRVKRKAIEGQNFAKVLEASVAAGEAIVLLPLPKQLFDLANQTAKALALDVQALIRQLVAEHLFEYVARAGKARDQLAQATALKGPSKRKR